MTKPVLASDWLDTFDPGKRQQWIDQLTGEIEAVLGPQSLALFAQINLPPNDEDLAALRRRFLTARELTRRISLDPETMFDLAEHLPQIDDLADRCRQFL